MSALRTLLVEDSRLAITEDATFVVKSAPAQSTYQPYMATSISSSNVTFSVQVPSENIVIDREVYIRSAITLRFTAAVPDADCAVAPVQAFSYGLTEAFQAYPLNALFLTTQATINNSSVSENTQDIMASLLSLYDKRDLNRFNSMTPSMIDSTYGLFSDAIGANANVLGAADSQAVDKSMTGRGTFPVEFLSVVHNYRVAGVPQPVNDSFVALAGSTENTWLFFIRTISTEPFLFLSPFLNLTPDHERAGLLGINNMAFVLNIDTSCKRVFSTALSKIVAGALLPKYITSTTLQTPAGAPGLENTELLLNYLSMSPEQMAKLSSPKNVVPYITYPRYLSNSTSQASIPAGSSSTLVSTSIQLSMIPDKLLICARVPMSQQTIAHSNSFLAISAISVTFNNASGLLASATQQDLFSKVSYVNGSDQSWPEFSGAVQNTALSGKANVVAGLGSVLVLDPVAQFSLPSYLSASSLGQFQLQFSLTVRNQFTYAIAPEIVIIAVNSGIFSTVAGSSQIFTGLLTRASVLAAQASDVKMSSGDLSRLVGGRLGSVLKRRFGPMTGMGMSGGASSKPALSRIMS
jgi:hypothetical protein